MVQGFVGTGMDVTDEEELTKALRKSEGELRQVLDRAPQLEVFDELRIGEEGQCGW